MKFFAPLFYKKVATRPPRPKDLLADAEFGEYFGDYLFTELSAVELTEAGESGLYGDAAQVQRGIGTELVKSRGKRGFGERERGELTCAANDGIIVDIYRAVHKQLSDFLRERIKSLAA